MAYSERRSRSLRSSDVFAGTTLCRGNQDVWIATIHEYCSIPSDRQHESARWTDIIWSICKVYDTLVLHYPGKHFADILRSSLDRGCSYRKVLDATMIHFSLTSSRGQAAPGFIQRIFFPFWKVRSSNARMSSTRRYAYAFCSAMHRKRNLAKAWCLHRYRTEPPWIAVLGG